VYLEMSQLLVQAGMGILIPDVDVVEPPRMSLSPTRKVLKLETKYRRQAISLVYSGLVMLLRSRDL
jgi:hypothetical protein